MRHHRKTRRFRGRSNNRSFFRDNGIEHSRVGSRQFTNGRSRNNFKGNLNPEKLVEKYTTLAKEALTSGDKILSENYLQHADHFKRIIDNKNTSQNHYIKTTEIADEKKNENELSQQEKTKEEVKEEVKVKEEAEVKEEI